MPSFGLESTKQYLTLDERLKRVLAEAITYFDFSIIEGYRNKEQQEAAFAKGATQLHYPHGNHNQFPSRAADCMPFPVDWSEKREAIARIAFMHGVIFACAKRQGVKVRFGFDWNRNLDPRDETFLDYPHIELDEP